MKKLLPILLWAIVSCNQQDTINKDKFILSVKNYYLMQTKDIKSIDDLKIDSIVPVTEKRQLEDAIAFNEKRYYYFIEAKDDEYADSTAKNIEQMQRKLKTAESSTVLYYTVYHTIKFTGNDQVPRKRQSYFDITSDYQIKPNAVTEKDQLEGIKGERIYNKPYAN